MVDVHLAELYNVATKVFNQAVKRNIERFPEEFMFALNETEWEFLRPQFGASNNESLRSQIVTLKKGGRGRHRKYLPYAFTEQGVAMLSSVLNSQRAIQVNIAIMRAFVRLREMVSTHRALTVKLAELENKIAKHDKGIQDIFDRIYELADPSKLEDTIGSTD